MKGVAGVSGSAGAGAADPVLANDWHPVAAAEALAPGAIVAATLLGQELALWRAADGALRAFENRCPHRGVRLTMGSVDRARDALVCRYHGWAFDAAGLCVDVPAQPGEVSRNVAARSFAVREQYGLVWVCLGTPAAEVLPFPEYHDPHLRKVLCGPYEVNAAGPRIVENFLDMGHFGTVHAGILGDAEHMQVEEYHVERLPDVPGGGLLATRCFAWQPRSNALAESGSMVEYTYRVVRPLTAILTKVPDTADGFREAISLHVAPVDETRCRVWIILAMTNFVQTEAELRAFQDTIFLQDLPILENQLPARLPLDPAAEVSVRADRSSVAYRRYLREIGLVYGCLRPEEGL